MCWPLAAHVQTCTHKLLTGAVLTQGLPFDCTEEDVRAVFEGWLGLQDVRLTMSKTTGASKGFGFLVSPGRDTPA